MLTSNERRIFVFLQNHNRFNTLLLVVVVFCKMLEERVPHVRSVVEEAIYIEFTVATSDFNSKTRPCCQSVTVLKFVMANWKSEKLRITMTLKIFTKVFQGSYLMVV